MRSSVCLLLLIGCAGAPQPEDVARAYAEALRTRDVDRIWALSSGAYRAAHDKTEVEDFIEEHPDEVDRMASALDGGKTAAAVGELRLVREDGGWRITSGGLEPFGASTPEAAAETFFRAVESGRFDVVRSVMPEKFAMDLARDDDLGAYLRKIGPRIQAARAALPRVQPGQARIEGLRARIEYGEGRGLELVEEAGRWKVLDLE